MNLIKVKILIVLSVNLFVLLNSQNIFAQNTNTSNPKAKLIDSYQWLGSDDASARIDELRLSVDGNSNSKGLIIVYCGKVCQYGEVEAHLRGIEQAFSFAKLDRKKFFVIPGGFREKTVIEFWIVPENACFPLANSTVNIKDVKFKGISRNKFPYLCC